MKPVDVLIVGGGAVGLACAHYLVQAGRKVCVIERDTVGSGASHGNCGLVVASYLLPLCVPGVVRKEFRGCCGPIHRSTSDPRSTSPSGRGCSSSLPDAARRFLRRPCGRANASWGARTDCSRRCFGDHALDAEFERRGHLIVFRTEHGMQGYEAKNEQLRPFGHAAEPLTGRALRALEPALREDVYGAWYHSTDSHLRPDRLLRPGSRFSSSPGSGSRKTAGWSAFARAGDRVTAVVTSKGEFAAAEVVLAAGAWSAPIAAELGLRLPLQPGKGYSVTMARPAVCPRIPCSFAERRVVATPWPSGYRLGGTMEFSGFSTALDPRRLAALTAAAGEYLTDPVGHPVVERWAGLRPMTYDDLPVIGRAPRFRNLTLATGHGMLGITTAPATGKLVAEIVCGREPHIDARPFRPERFN